MKITVIVLLSVLASARVLAEGSCSAHAADLIAHPTKLSGRSGEPAQLKSTIKSLLEDFKRFSTGELCFVGGGKRSSCAAQVTAKAEAWANTVDNKLPPADRSALRTMAQNYITNWILRNKNQDPETVKSWSTQFRFVESVLLKKSCLLADIFCLA